MNIPYVIVADSKHPFVSELLEEVDLVVQLQKGTTIIDCEDVLSCEVNRPEDANKTFK